MRLFNQYIKDSKRILIISSQPVDPDCISSGLVMKKYLEYLGKDVKLLLPRELTNDEKEFHSYLPYFDELITKDSRDELAKGDFDTLILLDGTNLVQFYDYKNTALPVPQLDKNKIIIQIDHHLGNPEDLAKYQIKNSTASSTIEIILSEVVPHEFLTAKLATLAYAGLMGDTGNFRWNFNTNTLKLAAMLLEKGAEPAEFLDKMFFAKEKEYIQMLAYAVNNVEYDDELHSLFLFMPVSKKQKDNISEETYQILKHAYFGEIAQSVVGYSRGFIMHQDSKTGLISVSARGNNFSNKISLPELYSRMGGNGGGHFNAAGMDIEGDFDEIKKKLKDTLRTMLQEQNS